MGATFVLLLLGVAAVAYDRRLSKLVEREQAACRESTLAEACRRSEEQYRLLAENATDMITRADLNGVRLYVSPACREMIGYEPEQLIGMNIAEIAHPDDLSVINLGFDGLISSLDGQQTITYRLRHRNGHWVSLESHRKLVRDKTGAPLEYVSVARDVTERLRLEEQLRQSQKMEAMGQLTGGVAHDFNNLLGLIMGNAELIAEQVHHDLALRGAAELVVGTAERGARLTHQLLAFSRKQDLAPEPLDINEAISSLSTLLMRSLGEQVEVTTKLEPDLPRLWWISPA
jgi:PAS domain S-box-containing protein